VKILKIKKKNLRKKEAGPNASGRREEKKNMKQGRATWREELYQSLKERKRYFRGE